MLASLAWLAWLVSIGIFNAVYRPARHGRKIAYETVVSFLFLSLVLAIILLTPSAHGSDPEVGCCGHRCRDCRSISRCILTRVEMYRP